MAEFPNLVSPIPKDAPQPPKRRAGAAPEGRWVYRNAEGRALKVKLRFPDAGRGKVVLPFTLWEAAPGKLQWFQRDLDAPRPLYALDALASRMNAPVLVVEGEKTAEAAQGLFPGWVVTTSGSATSAGSTDWSPLKGRNVVVWPDHDEPGRRYGEEVATALGGLGCPIKVVQIPPDFPGSWDLADDFPSGWGGVQLEELLAAAEATPASRPLGSPGKAPHPTLPLPNSRSPWVVGDVARMLREAAPPVQWLVEGLIPTGVPGIFAARAGAGKSTTALLIGLGLASGQGVLGRAVSPDSARGVIYVGMEDDEAEAHRRLQRGMELLQEDPRWNMEAQILMEQRLRLLFPDRMSGARFRLEDQWRSLDRFASEIPGGCGLIVLDTLARLSEGDENSAAETRRFTEAQAALAQTTGAAVLAIHHVGKGNDTPSDKKLWQRLHPEALRGSSAIEASARFILTLAALSPQEAQTAGLDPEGALRGSFVALHLAKMSQAEKGATVLLERRSGEMPGAGFLCPHPESERALATIQGQAAILKLTYRDKVLLAIAEAGSLGGLDQERAAVLIWPDAKDAKGQWRKLLSQIRSTGWLSEIHLTDPGWAHAQTLGFQRSARNTDSLQNPRGGLMLLDVPSGASKVERVEQMSSGTSSVRSGPP